jgi:rare lipoprotein A
MPRMLCGLLPTLILAMAHFPAFAGDRSVGMASFYPGLRGELTAAHRSLPFGTQVRVTRIGSGKSVVVRINDRGPFVAGRVIDLSRRAAEYLQMISAGVARVRLEVVKATPGMVLRRNPEVHASRGKVMKSARKIGHAKVAHRSKAHLAKPKGSKSQRSIASLKSSGHAVVRSRHPSKHACLSPGMKC